MKIRKNLSDADMFRGVEEEESFETALLSDDSRRIKLRKNSSAIKKEAEAMMLPPETEPLYLGSQYGMAERQRRGRRLESYKGRDQHYY